jgi:hypothetical protein
MLITIFKSISGNFKGTRRYRYDWNQKEVIGIFDLLVSCPYCSHKRTPAVATVVERKSNYCSFLYCFRIIGVPKPMRFFLALAVVFAAPFAVAYAPASFSPLQRQPSLLPSEQRMSPKTQLNMAFSKDKPSNMFDGPRALVKERDACGVGFIANTKSGGKACNILLYEQFVHVMNVCCAVCVCHGRVLFRTLMV